MSLHWWSSSVMAEVSSLLSSVFPDCVDQRCHSFSVKRGIFRGNVLGLAGFISLKAVLFFCGVCQPFSLVFPTFQPSHCELPPSSVLPGSKDPFLPQCLLLQGVRRLLATAGWGWRSTRNWGHPEGVRRAGLAEGGRGSVLLCCVTA